MSFLRFLMLLSLVVWIGGIVFFCVRGAHGVSGAAHAHLAGTWSDAC